jgi:hypothetical protein
MLDGSQFPFSNKHVYGARSYYFSFIQPLCTPRSWLKNDVWTSEVRFDNSPAILEPFEMMLMVIAEETRPLVRWASEHVIEAQS